MKSANVLVSALVAFLTVGAGEGTTDLAAQLVTFARQVQTLEFEEGAALAGELLENPQLAPERIKADVLFGRGLLLAELADQPSTPGPEAAGSSKLAQSDFKSCQAFAGPGALRLDAAYGSAWVDLKTGERWFAQIPEVMQAAGVAPTAPNPAANAAAKGSGGAPEEEAPEPLEMARKSYLQARTGLIRRLRMDWRDEDTRANLEWIQRRLRELDEIEEAREQQQEESEDQEQSEEQEDSEEGEDSEEEQDEGEEGEKSDEEQEPSEQDQEQSEDSEQESDEQDQSQEDQPEPEEESGEEESAEQPEAGEPEEGETEPKDVPEERLLTREEVQRLLDRLKEVEDERERIRARVRASRRVPVERDW